MDGEADLSIGVDFENYINSIWKDEVEYHLTVSNVHLKSSGKELELHDNQTIAIALYDEDCNQVGALFDPIILYLHNDYETYPSYMKAFYEKLKHGKGECYAEFISQKATLPADEANVKLLTDMAQRAKWYSIYLYTKPLDDDY